MDYRKKDFEKYIKQTVEEAWLKTKDNSDRKIIMETGRASAIMMQESLIGRPLTKKERLTYEEGSYSVGSGVDGFIKHRASKREDLKDGVYAFSFKRDGTTMYVVEQYQDHYRINHKYIDKKEYEELTTN